MAGILQDWHTLQEKSMEVKPFPSFEVAVRSKDSEWHDYRMAAAVRKTKNDAAYQLIIDGWGDYTEQSITMNSAELEAAIALLTAVREAEIKRTEVKG